MKKIIPLFVVITSLLYAPLFIASELPTGSDLHYAMSYYNQYVVTGKSCPSTVAINARNKSAILNSAMPGYAAATVATENPSQLADYFSAVRQRPDRCQSPLFGLPSPLVVEIFKTAKFSNSNTRQNVCPNLERNKKQVFELYLEALAAKVVWDIVNKQC